MKNIRNIRGAFILSGFLFLAAVSNASAQDTASRSRNIDPAQEQGHVNSMQENRNGSPAISNDQEAQNNGQAAVNSKLKITNTKKQAQRDTVQTKPDSLHGSSAAPSAPTQRPVTPRTPTPPSPQQPSPAPPPVTPVNGAQIRQPNGQLNTPPPSQTPPPQH
jgi:hypothetical protein